MTPLVVLAATAMKPHPLLTAKMPLRLTKELQQAMVRWFIDLERLWARKFKRSDQHPRRYKLAKNQQLPKP